MLPLLAALLYFVLCVDRDAIRGDLAKMTQDEFSYTPPTLDSALVTAPCRDVEVNELPSRQNDEIVVFGDSFSAKNTRWPESRWHQFMGAIIGKKILNVNTQQNPVAVYLKALSNFPQYLGDTVFLENVERAIIYRFAYLDFGDTCIAPREKDQEPSWREKAGRLLRTPVQYYQRKLGIDVPARVATLDRALFSCRSDKLYFYEEDLLEHNDWETATAVENYRRLDSLSKARGITLVLVAIPDKYTVYHDFIDNDTAPKRLLEAPCPFDTFERFVNTYPAIHGLVEKGTKDVYLPDDTHFSIPTSKTVGTEVAKQLGKTL